MRLFGWKRKNPSIAVAQKACECTYFCVCVRMLPRSRHWEEVPLDGLCQNKQSMSGICKTKYRFKLRKPSWLIYFSLAENKNKGKKIEHCLRRLLCRGGSDGQLALFYKKPWHFADPALRRSQVLLAEKRRWNGRGKGLGNQSSTELGDISLPQIWGNVRTQDRRERELLRVIGKKTGRDGMGFKRGNCQPTTSNRFVYLGTQV